MFAELRNDGRDADELLAILPVNPVTTVARPCNGATAIMRVYGWRTVDWPGR